jgi:hypothetical protein
VASPEEYRTTVDGQEAVLQISTVAQAAAKSMFGRGPLPEPEQLLNEIEAGELEIALAERALKPFADALKLAKEKFGMTCRRATLANIERKRRQREPGLFDEDDN